MKSRKVLLCAALLWLLCLLTGCGMRSRVLLTAQSDFKADTGSDQEPYAAVQPEVTGEIAADEWNEGANGKAAEEPEQNASSQNDPDAEQREYASDASAELSQDTEQTILVVDDKQEAAAAPAPGEGAKTGARQSDGAQLMLNETLTEEEAQKLGVSQEAPRADTVFQYYQAMLKARLGSLFECKRLYVYWETADDYQTVHKTSAEHSIILLAGGYDIAAKRQEDALLVDDGWIGRKNPGCIVKCVNAQILGERVQSTLHAKAAYTALLARNEWDTMEAVKNDKIILLSVELMKSSSGQLAAALYMAKVMYPDLFTDLDPDEALALLRQEEMGAGTNGIYAYTLEG